MGSFILKASTFDAVVTIEMCGHGGERESKELYQNSEGIDGCKVVLDPLNDQM